METVSKNLAVRNYDALTGMIAEDALEIIKENVDRMTEKERREIALDRKNILRVYWHAIKLSEDRDMVPPKRFVEITVKYHVLDGQLVEPTGVSKIIGKMERHTFICVYRFRKNFTEGVSGDWVINFLTHYRMSDIKAKLSEEFYGIFKKK